jgi:glucose-6-phosphate 1-dehydrogenase
MRPAAITAKDCITAQYTASDSEPGYTDDDTVPKDSKTPTFATMVMYVRNPRWDGVPFIFRAGKALNETKAEIRIQYKSPPGSSALFPPSESTKSTEQEPVARNELVIRLQPDEAVYLKCNVKEPGLANKWTQLELDLNYRTRYPCAYSKLPDAYTKLILQCLRGESGLFVREDELRSAWRVFTPLLHAIDDGLVEPKKYAFGTRGPTEHDEMVQRLGFIVSRDYSWNPPSAVCLNPKL